MNELIEHNSNNLDLLKQSLNNLEQLGDLKNAPIIKTALTTLLPGVGNLISDTFDNIFIEFQSSKRDELLNLIISDSTITPEMVNDVEFIMNFAKTISAINKLASNDKVKYFANLLKNSYFAENKINNDEFSELFECLNTLSFKQIKILCILYNIENNPEPYIDTTISEKEHHIKRYWGSFKQELKNQLNINEDEVFSSMKSLERTGLFTIYNGFSFGSPDFGQLTPYFNKFAKIVLSM